MFPYVYLFRLIHDIHDIQSNRTDTARPHTTWKWKHMLKKVVTAGQSIADKESEDTDDTDSEESHRDTASTGDIDESPDIPDPSVPSPLHTQSYGKAKKTKDGELFIKRLWSSVSSRRYKRTREEIAFISRRVFLQVTPQSGTNWFMYWMRCLY